MKAYRCPLNENELVLTQDGLQREDKFLYPFLELDGGIKSKIPYFLFNEQNPFDIYHNRQAEEYYQNFLDWLSASFNTTDDELRNSLVSRLNLKKGDRVLVTGCGLGHDLPLIASIIGPTGELYAQDFSHAMIRGAIKRVGDLGNVYLSVSDACKLPLEDRYFDAAFHFGGINLFSNVKAGIYEMNRVVKPGGKVVFGDEGIGPWLKDVEYGKVAICNNPLWSAEAPLAALPHTASEVNLSWILGNCFYVIEYTVSDKMPYMNIDIKHKGKRGGSARTRFFGQLEGVSPHLKEQALKASINEGTSIHDWLENAISQKLNQQMR